MQNISFKRHRFLPEIIHHAVWLYARFTLSYRDIEDLLSERGLDISYETVRRWFQKFSGPIARNLRRTRSTLKLVRKLLNKQGWPPTRIVTDKLRSYHVAFRTLGLSAEHIDNKRANNRAENSHQPVRRRERKMQKFKSPGSAQKFLNVHSATYNIFYVQRHLLKRTTFKQCRAERLMCGNVQV